MPVFITPPAAKREINCTHQLSDAKTLALQCSNTGSAYAQIREAVVTRGPQTLARFEGGSYILPGARKTVSLKGEQALTAGQAQLVVTFDDGQSLTTSIALP